MKALICPVCSSGLLKERSSLKCRNNHCFDIASEGYVNLLTGSKSGSQIGDSKQMARSRRAFLSKGWFEPLAEALYNELKGESSPTVADICCGEGYYSSYLKARIDGDYYGFDISKEMIRLAAKRKSGVTYFVANMTSIPLKSNCADFAIHLFAPFYESEFSRILKPGGQLISVIPGREHLYSLKEAVYDKPYYNDESAPEVKELRLCRQVRVKNTVCLESSDDIQALFCMTPYYYRTGEENKKRLLSLKRLQTQTDFILNIYQK